MDSPTADMELCGRSLEQSSIPTRFLQSGPKFFVQPMSEKLCEQLVSKMGNYKKERKLEAIEEYSQSVFWKVQQNEDLTKEIISNARIVEWNDGSKGLFVGKNYFPLNEKTNSQYCFFSEEENKIFCKKTFPETVLLTRRFNN